MLVAGKVFQQHTCSYLGSSVLLAVEINHNTKILLFTKKMRFLCNAIYICTYIKNGASNEDLSR